jgi:hypothetical protein
MLSLRLGASLPRIRQEKSLPNSRGKENPDNRQIPTHSTPATDTPPPRTTQARAEVSGIPWYHTSYLSLVITDTTSIWSQTVARANRPHSMAAPPNRFNLPSLRSAAPPSDPIACDGRLIERIVISRIPRPHHGMVEGSTPIELTPTSRPHHASSHHDGDHRARPAPPVPSIRRLSMAQTTVEGLSSSAHLPHHGFAFSFPARASQSASAS